MRIYFAAPYANVAVPTKGSDYGWTTEGHNNWLGKITAAIEKMGHKIHLPHRDDHQWGRVFPKIEKLCPNQYEKITKGSDLLIAYIGNPQSGGVCIEIGYAISHKVPVVIIKRRGEKITTVIQGLKAISRCEIIEFDEDEELVEKLKIVLKNF